MSQCEKYRQLVLEIMNGLIRNQSIDLCSWLKRAHDLEAMEKQRRDEALSTKIYEGDYDLTEPTK